MCAREHGGTSCVCVAVLTHGEAGGALLAADRPYEAADLLALLQRGAALAGRPKLLLLQACRGAALDAGRPRLDAAAAPLLPTHIDTLVLASSVDGERHRYRFRLRGDGVAPRARSGAPLDPVRPGRFAFPIGADRRPPAAIAAR